MSQPGATLVPSIAPSGVNLYFPVIHAPDYLALLNRELKLKESFFSFKSPVISLWLRTSPFLQLQGDELTELVFRLRTGLNIKAESCKEKGVALRPEDCSKDNLALLKGLGFGIQRLIIDPTDDVPQILAAINAIRDYSCTRIQSEILVTPNVNKQGIGAILSALIDTQCEEIEFCPASLSPRGESQLPVLDFAFGQLEPRYERYGDRCFKRHDHPDHKLRTEHRLCYSPWGFHDIKITNWLGLGVGAIGIKGGYLCHNLSDISHYRHTVEMGIAPVDSWSSKPVQQLSHYQLLQSLYCYHQLDHNSLSDQRHLAALQAKGWLTTADTVTAEGIRHFWELYEVLQ